MSYRSILAFLPSAGRASGIWRCASTLAHVHDAHAIGLVVSPDFTMPYGLGVGLPTQIFDDSKQVKRKQLEDIQEIFDNITADKGIESELRHIESARSLVADTVIEHALSSDLLVLPQATGEEWGPWSELPDRIILNSGRPAVVVPDGLPIDAPPKRIVLAWSDSPQSARATFDALPLMVRADRVQVLSVNLSSVEAGDRSLAVDQVALALSRHGVNVEAVTDSREHMSVGEAILDHAREYHADMLIMGCYGHSKFRETLLGGASRRILHELPLPVLMSH